jgi:hypothetical protein
VRGTNADLFPQALQLYVEHGAHVADTTYGQGVFWRKVPKDAYQLHATDLEMGVDARQLPYGDGSMAAVVFDPPWMPTSSGRTHAPGTATAAFETHYRNNQRADGPGLKYREAILSLYREAAVEALRVLAPRGVYLVKCQDEVHANKQCLTHVELLVMFQGLGFVWEDLFVLVRTNRPGVSRMLKQAHARKNHSYLLVVRKPRAPRTRAALPPPAALG